MNSIVKNKRSSGRHQHAAKQMTTLDLVTTTRVTVPVALYEDIRSYISWNLPYLHRSHKLVPEDLVGLGFWCDLSDAEQRMAKACIAHLSQTKVLPIRARDAEMEQPHFYELA